MKKPTPVFVAQPLPKPGKENVTERLIEHIQARAAKGLETYGRPLEAFNGRDPVLDALDEALDLAQYLMQLKLEREHLIKVLAQAYDALIEPVPEKALLKEGAAIKAIEEIMEGGAGNAGIGA